VWKAYYSNRSILGLLLLGTVVVELAVYVGMMVYMYRKGKQVDD
jgi:NADH:ubiquinone oxidoreductase subunit K